MAKNTKIVFTPTELRYIKEYGEDVCIAAYRQAEAGSGACTVGEMFLYGIVEPTFYTKSGDILINAGRKLHQQSKK